MMLGQLVRGRSKKDPVLRVSGICALVAVCCFLLKRGQPLLHRPTLLRALLPPAKATSRRWECLVPFPTPHGFSPFPLLGARNYAELGQESQASSCLRTARTRALRKVQ